MDDQIAAEQQPADGRDMPDRASALKRSGLIFLGGFAAAAVTPTPADALRPPPPQDNPPYGIGFFARALPARHPGPAPSPAPSPSLAPRTDYRRAVYFAIVVKNAHEHGIPNTRDLALLQIPLPTVGLELIGAYEMPPSLVPHATSFSVHGIHTHYDPTSVPLPGPNYSVFLLVYGQP